MKISITIVGKMPLLMHQDDVEQSDTLNAWRKDTENRNKSVAGDDRSPPWTWQTYLYHDGTNATIPTHNLLVAVRTGASKKKLKGNTTYKALSQSDIIASEMFLDFEICHQGNWSKLPISPFVAIRDKPFEQHQAMAEKHGFELFVKRAKVGQSKHVRVRPRFDQWRASGVFSVTSDDLTMPVLRGILGLAGLAGLGDWRPSAKQSPGPFGTFSATVEEIK